MKETVKNNEGKDVVISCKHITGRKAWQLAPQIMDFTGLKQEKDGSFAVDLKMGGEVDIVWDFIVAESPEKDNVCAEDMQLMYESYAKKSIDFVIKKKLENLSIQ
jgi:hypothetical protein